MPTGKEKWRIRFNAPYIAGKELYYIAKAVEDGRLSGNGQFTRRCQAWLEENLECALALLTHSGTAALEMASLLCRIGPGDEVILPSFTFVSTANAFVLRGACPVFVDINRESLNIEPQLVEAAVTERTKAVVPVHYAGRACEMDSIVAVAERHGFYVIEDAAHAMMSTYGDRALGTIGNVGCLSFHQTKNIICGEGGALLVNDPELAERAQIVWEKGTNRLDFFAGKVDKYTWVDLGSSFLPSELTAAFLAAQFEHADEIVSKRLELCRLYRDHLSRLEADGLVRLPAQHTMGKENGHIFYLLTRDERERTQLLDHLAARGIYAAFHYVPLHSSPAGSALGRVAGPMTVTNEVSATLVRLPLHYELSREDAVEVAEEVSRFYGVEP